MMEEMLLYEKTSEYIKNSWDYAIKKKDVDKNFILPFDYIPPCIDGDLINLYYWDTYFTNLGLINDGKSEFALNNIKDLIYCLMKFGCVPNMCRANGATYASQPPLLFLMVKDYYDISKEQLFLSDAYDALKLEYVFWMSKRISETGLNRYGCNFDYNKSEPNLKDYSERVGLDISKLTSEQKKHIAINRVAEGESGHDYTPRFDGRAYEINPIDLNSYLYGFEKTMAEFSCVLKNNEQETWTKRAEKRKQLMDEYCLDKETGVYFDYDFVNKQRRNVFCGPCYLPFVFGITSDIHALNSVNDKLIAKYGVLCCEKLIDDGLTYQWGYPNSWAPYNWFGYLANSKNGNKKQAEIIIKAWLNNIAETFSKTGKLFEKYDAINGGVATVSEYGTPEMLGWTAGTFEKLLDLYKKGDF